MEKARKSTDHFLDQHGLGAADGVVDGVAHGVENTVTTAKNVITHPVRTVENGLKKFGGACNHAAHAVGHAWNNVCSGISNFFR